MKILLVFPPGTESVITPPLGLGYIASVLEQEGYSVKILDASLERKGTDEVLADIATYRPDIVGIMVLTVLYPRAKEVVQRVKREFPQIVTVAGGTHVSVLPEETLRDMEPDYIVVGEGEVTFLELVRALESQGNTGDIAGVGSINNGVVKVNSRRDLIADLDEIPFPARHLMKFKEYFVNRWTWIIRPGTTILTSRGCSFSCDFCANVSLWRRKYRQRSPQNVISEMVYLYDNFGIKSISFCDALFTANKAWIRELCREIVNTGIDFTWSCEAHVATLDRETMEIMRSSGCRALEIGVESGNELILASMNKGSTIPQVIKIFSLAKELNFGLVAFVIFGYIGETEDTAKQTIDLANRLNPDSISYMVATPFPGTDFRKKAAERKLITSDNWQDYDSFSTAAMRTETLSGADLLRLRNNAPIAFYSRKKYLWENVILKVTRGGYGIKDTWRNLQRAILNLIVFTSALLQLVMRRLHQTSGDRIGSE